MAVITSVIAIGCTAPDPSQSPAELASCQNPVVPYEVNYPSDWYVVPGDEDAGTQPCTYFSLEPFEFVQNNAPLATGANAAVTAFPTCLEYESEPSSRRALEIDDFPAREEEFTEPLLIYQYVVEIREGDTCQDEAVLIIRTEGQAAGNYEDNKLMVRLLAEGLDIRPAN